jgi:hypothetical protein
VFPSNDCNDWWAGSTIVAMGGHMVVLMIELAQQVGERLDAERQLDLPTDDNYIAPF